LTTDKSFKTKYEKGMVELPFDVKKHFGKARPPVRVTINGYTYRSTPSVYGGKYFIPVRKSNEEAAGIRPEEIVSVTIAADTDIREVEPPRDLLAALKKNATAKARWEKLSYTAKKEHALALTEAKKPETRERRLEKILKDLSGKTK
jgi:Bacteriocin-protection, YdeI or OmpD-Associated/Domain of unknown function (DUF1905)